MKKFLSILVLNSSFVFSHTKLNIEFSASQDKTSVVAIKSEMYLEPKKENFLKSGDYTVIIQELERKETSSLIEAVIYKQDKLIASPVFLTEWSHKAELSVASTSEDTDSLAIKLSIIASNEK